jgi:hypothetical protein
LLVLQQQQEQQRQRKRKNCFFHLPNTIIDFATVAHEARKITRDPLLLSFLFFCFL